MSDKKNILFIYNGGTIGQVVGEDGVSRPPEDEKEFESVCKTLFAMYPNDNFTFKMLNTKESSNMSAKDWKETTEYIYENQGDYDAVVMAIGTDTLAHMATAVGLGFYNDDIQDSELMIPVVITGAQKELGARASDADDNLEIAIMSAKKAIKHNVADVLVAFSKKVMHGPRVIKKSEIELDAFESPAYPDIGNDTSKGVQLQNVNLVRTLDMKSKKTIAAIYNAKRKSGEGAPSSNFAIALPSTFEEGVKGLNLMTLSIQPNLFAYGIKNLIDDPKNGAIVFRSLGAGNTLQMKRIIILMRLNTPLMNIIYRL